MAPRKRPIRWQDNEVLTLVECYKTNECLWNPQLKDYSDKKQREKAYEILRQQLNIEGLSVEEIRCKIKGIRTTYCEELRKMLRSEENGSKTYHPRVYWFSKVDSFLRVVAPKRMSSITPKENGAARKPCPKEPPKIVNTPVSNAAADEYSNSPSSGRTKNRPDAPTTSTGHIENAQTVPSSCRGVQNVDDEFDLFARSIAIQLRKLPELDALDLMQEMQVMVLNRKRQLLNKTSSRAKVKERKKRKYRSISAQSDSNDSGDQDEEDPLTDDVVVLEVKREF